VLGLPTMAPAVHIGQLHHPATDLAAAMASMPSLPPDALLLVLVDAWSRRVRSLARALFEEFGTTIRVMGGGAGSLTNPGAPSLFTNDGFLDDAALLLPIPWPAGIGIGVAHGWKPMSPSLKVTAAKGTTILELDHEPARLAYDRLLLTAPHSALKGTDFLDRASRHPLGLKRLDAELVIRDPMQLDADGLGLVCLCEVPTGSFVHLMRADIRALLRAARHADEVAALGIGERRPALRLVFDCVSREAFMGRHIRDELACFADDVPTIGALSIGEIAADSEDYLEYHNKSLVVAQLAEESRS